jgi:glutathione S-transferase
MTVIVHHLENSRSQRVLWLLEELGFSYELQRYARDPKTMLAPPALKRVHPLGKSPVVEDVVDGQRRVLVETGAILEYFVAKADGRLGAPADIEGALRYRQFMHYAEGSLMPPLFVALVLSRVPLLGGVAKKRFQPMIDVHLDFVESELARRPWIAGDVFTAADVIMSFPLQAARTRAGASVARSATSAWLDKIQARAAYRAALARGGPFENLR